MIAVRSRTTLHLVFSIVNLTVFFLLMALLSFFIVISLLDIQQNPIFLEKEKKMQMERRPCLSGPLALNEISRSPLALSLEKQLVLLAKSVRPDFSKEKRAYRIGVRGTSIDQVVCEGEPIFCNFDLHSSGGVRNISFVSDVGEIKMVPQLIDDRSIKFLVEQTGQEAFEIMLRSGEFDFKKGASDPIKALQKAKWWGQDAFFSKYGGELYSTMGLKQKIEVDSEVLYVKDGNYLSFEGGRWRVLYSLKEASSQEFLGFVRFNNQGNLDLEVWDDKGFSVLQTQLIKEIEEEIETKPAHLITQPKRRTAQGVSCKIGKQRWILKPGDWLLSTETGFHRLESSKDIERYLSQKSLGELIVIDQFENGYLTGHVIGKRRTLIEPFTIQVATSQLKGRAQK